MPTFVITMILIAIFNENEYLVLFGEGGRGVKTAAELHMYYIGFMLGSLK